MRNRYETDEVRSIVTKFGGSVVYDAMGMRKAADIIFADPRRRWNVFSAPGARPGVPNDKITDRTIDCIDLAAQGKKFDQSFDPIEQRFMEIAKDLLEIPSPVSGWLNDLYEAIKNRRENYAQSRPDIISTQIMGLFTGLPVIDPATIIRFNQNGKLSSFLTTQLVRKQLKNGNSIFLIGGYSGATKDGIVFLLDRGGSDVTMSEVGRGVDADLCENWKNVPGVKTADLADGRTISRMTSREMRELSYRGADVLQYGAITPAMRAGIPIRVCDADHPELPGTMIVAERDVNEDESVIGISGRAGFTAVHVKKTGMNESIGIGRKLLRVLEENGISYEHNPSGLDSIAVIVQQKSLAGKEDVVLGEIKRRIHPDTINVETNLALVCVVGEGIRDHATDVNMKVFQTLSSCGIETRACSFATEGISIIVAIPEEKLADGVQALHSRFIV